ncbi:class I SAM-dependent methyltransferase [Microbacterium sp. NPDC076895]|uniref:class I SAM-dependent methyltransferase n=1 Tax=Microbacterium sp. NPDC076895 TaxID=3154957 RepID=UPI00344AE300
MPLHPDPMICAALASDLTAAGFTAEALRSAWGSVGDAAIGRGLRDPAVRALVGRGDALATLARLLGLGMQQPVNAVDAALPRTGVAGLVTLGLAAIEGDAVVPTALIRPQEWGGGADADAGEWWIASDLDEAALGGALPTDHVLGVGGASLTLAGLQVTTPAGRVLDLGTGCGIQALRARLYAGDVIATDISTRALGFARLSAALNGVDGIDVRHGSLFEPVVGERFDRVVSNPPFVITPRGATAGGISVPAYEYRDGGAVGDDLVRQVVTGVAGVLADGGIAQFLGNWEYRDGRDGLDRVREWVAAASVPMDAWIIEREILSPLDYAQLWVRDGGTPPGSPEYAALIDLWLEDFEERRVTGIGFGYVLLRRPASATVPLSRFERVSSPAPQEGLGADLARALEVHDVLGTRDDVGLAASAFTTPADVTEARHFVPGAEDPTIIELRQGRGFGRTLAVDPGLAALVGACDGELPIGVLIDAIAELLEVDAAALRADLLPRVRELAFLGFLDPVA